MNYRINPMTNHGIGAEIHGLDLTADVTEGTRARLNADLARHHVLVIRDQKLAAAQFLKAGELFGNIQKHQRKNQSTAEHPDVYEIRNMEIAPGQYIYQGPEFHTDHSNEAIPPKATMLHAISLPTRGGDTQFVDMHAAYDDLPQAMKQRIGGLRAVHVFNSKYAPRKMRPADTETLKHLPPPAAHPLVRTHPENGRRFIYINPCRIESIEGMSDDDSQALIAELMKHATQPKYEYRHKWLYGDLVIWDNRSVIHKANGDYDMREVRRMYRIMIQGVAHPGETPLTANAGLQPVPAGVA